MFRQFILIMPTGSIVIPTPNIRVFRQATFVRLLLKLQYKIPSLIKIDLTSTPASGVIWELTPSLCFNVGLNQDWFHYLVRLRNKTNELLPAKRGWLYFLMKIMFCFFHTLKICFRCKRRMFWSHIQCEP